MKKDNSTYDWMLVTVRGYNPEKGYIYGNRHPDGKGVIIAKKHSVRRDWVKALSSENERTFTPPKSVIAVFGAEVKDENSGFTIASWATPISKNLGQEDVFVTPIKVAAAPRLIKNARRVDKSTFIDAIVLDQNPVSVRMLNDLQSAAISALKPDGVSSLNLDGIRGFMIRIGHTAPDGSIEAASWEFLGRRDNTPEQIWNLHWNRPPQAGRQQNILKAVLTAAQQALRDTGSYVEVVGLSRVLINDFGKEERVRELASLPNYKTSTDNGVIPSYSLAAISVEKHAGSRIIKQQIPLPRNKVVNHLAGVLGNHVPGVSMPVVIQPILEPVAMATPAAYDGTISPTTPLSIVDYVNQHGQVNSFEVIGTKSTLDLYKNRIESAVPGITPFRVRGKCAYSFPIRFKRTVEAALSDLSGTAPLYVKDTTIEGRPYITIAGKIDQEPYRTISNDILTKLGARTLQGLLVVEESKRASLVSAVSIVRANTTSNNSVTNQQFASVLNSSAQSNQSRQERTSNKKFISFSDWQQSRFGKDPYAMLDFLSGEISAFAEEAGIDWVSAKAAVTFSGVNQRGKLVKTRDIRPLDKSHTGSVAMAAHLHDKQGTLPNDSIVWFKINFFNKKILKDDVVSFDAYPFLKEEYDRDIDRGVDVTHSRANLEEIKKQNVQRQREAQARIAQQEHEDQQSRNFWAQRIPTMPKEDGSNNYFSSKGILNLLNDLDIRSGTDNRGRYSIISLYDLNDNFVGAQRIYENYWEDDKGRRTNKNFIRGTLFKDDATNLPYGTHRLVGTIDPSQPILFCEGVADSATDRAATGLPVVICLNKGNLYHVVGLYRQKYPNTRLIIAHDNDIYNKKKGNVGFVAALDAARDHNAEYVGPDFNGIDTDTKPTDFNDLEQIAGMDVVRNQIRNVRVPPVDPLNFHKLKVQAVGLDSLDRQINAAVAEVVADGSHGADENRICRVLLLRASLAYGYDEILNVLGEKAKSAFESAPENTIDSNNNQKFPVSISEREGASRKKYSLISDHSGTRSENIKSALRKVLGSKHLPFNEHLNGWVAPYPVLRLLDCFLHEDTGASRVYIGQSRSKKLGSLYVVRGDFSDPSFRGEIEKSIRYASPQYNESEYGFVIPDDRAIPYVRETLRSYLVPTRDLEVQVTSPKVEVPVICHTLLDEAVRMSGQSKGDIVLAHFALLFRQDGNIFNEDDFVFSAIYSRSLNSFSHLDPEVRHEKALIDACQSARALLDAGIADTVLSVASIQRLGELVTHLEYIVDTDKVDARSADNLSNEEFAAFERAIEQHSIDHDDALNIVLGLHNSVETDVRNSFLSSYQKELFNQQSTASANNTTPHSEQSANNTASKTSTSRSAVLEEQHERVGKLLEIVRLVVSKGFDEEDLYDHFITQPGSPYHDHKKNTFNDVLYRQDMLYLSSTSSIDGWKPKSISTTSQLFYAVYNDVANSRIGELENYINSYFGVNGVTTFKTFNKYFSGNQELAIDVSHPYVMEGEVNFELIAHDLEHLTELTSIHELYRELSHQFERSQEKQEQADTYSASTTPEEATIIGDVIYETINNDRKTVVTQYDIQDRSIYEIVLEENAGGRWTRLYHNFNIDRDVALEHARRLHDNETDITSIAGQVLIGTRGSVSVSTLEQKDNNGNSISLKEVDTGPSTYFFIEEKRVLDGEQDITNHGILVGYQQALEKYDGLVDERKEILTPLHEDVELSNSVADKQSLVDNPDIENLSQRFREWARSGLAVEDLIDTLRIDYQIVLEDSTKATIEKQYSKLVEKLHSEDQIRSSTPDERYHALYAITIEFAKNEVTYDEYLADFFKPDGATVERNPYWHAPSRSIDRKSAFSDIRAAGYQSLAQYYEGIFQTINQRKSTDIVLCRVGGFISGPLDTIQPIRPQFHNLDILLSSGTVEPRSAFVPPFKEWLDSPNAFRAVHPILNEDLSIANKTDLLKNYNRDAFLLLADIHGISQLNESSSEKIVDSILAQWNTRQLVANMSYGELQDLDASTLTDLLEQLSLPVGGKQKERSDRLSKHISALRSISKLRLSQYSYINAVINYENTSGKAPNYAYRAINSFINDEIEFKDSIHNNIDDADISLLRVSIDRSLKLLSSVSPLERTLANAQEDSTARVVGIDQSKQSAMVYSENYDKTKYTLDRYQFRYLFPKNLSTYDAHLPPEITHHAVISDRIIGTASPVDIDHLVSQDIKPVSDAAVLSVCQSVKRWIEKYGYGCFINESGDSIVVHLKGNQWHTHTIGQSGLQEGGSYKSINDFIVNNIDIMNTFVDRDPVVEHWISVTGDRIHETVDTLKILTSSALPGIVIHENGVKDFLNQDPFNEIIGENNDETIDTQVRLVADRLQHTLYSEAWNSITGSESLLDNAKEAAYLFVTNLDLPASIMSNDVAVDSFYSITPVDAIKLYDEYMSSQKQRHSSLFGELEARYFDHLSALEKKNIAIDIAAGTYESIGHYLHEQTVIEALNRKLPGASEITEMFYNDIGFADGVEPITSHSPELRVNDIVLHVNHQIGNYSFGKVIDINDRSVDVEPKSLELIYSESHHLNKNGSNQLPALSFEEYLLKPESLVAPVNYLNIDPRTESGLSQLSMISYKKLADYASVLGANHLGDRISILTSISNVADARKLASEVANNPSREITDTERSAIECVTGSTTNDTQLKENLGKWNHESQRLTKLEIARRNYASYINNSILAQADNRNILSIKDKDSLIRVLEIPTVDMICSQISDVRDIAGYTKSDDSGEVVIGYAALALASLSREKLTLLLETVEPYKRVSPLISDNSLQWEVSYRDSDISTGKSFASIEAAIHTSLACIERYHLSEGDQVAWITSAGIDTGHVAKHCEANTTSVPIATTGKNGRTFVQEIPITEVYHVDEQDIQDRFKSVLSTINGDPTSIVSGFTELLNEQTTLSYKERVEAKILISMAESHAEEVLKRSRSLPDGFTIHQEGLSYVISQTGTDNAVPLNNSASYYSLSDLVQNATVQQRLLQLEEHSNATTQSATKPAEPVGNDSQRSHGEISPSSKKSFNSKWNLDAHVTSITGDNRETNGNGDDPTDDPPSGPGNGGVPRPRRLPSTDSPTSTRNSSSGNSPRTRGIGYHLPHDFEENVIGGSEHRLRHNLEALRLRRELIDTKRSITNNDKLILAKYTGWGGLPSIFSNQHSYNQDRSALFNYLNEGEYDQLKRSVLTAFYTPPSISRAIWSAIEQFGFRGGLVLDPSTGTGQFIGSTPKQLAQNCSFIGKEIEPVSADIAKYLYGAERIHQEPFEKSKLPDNYFDVSISNIPFGDIKVFDPSYKKYNFKIHDYFFAKALDKTRPGGIIAFITSTGTLDKKDPSVRQHIFKSADLVGAIRLPRKTFKDYAGTDVSADIIFLQKRFPNASPGSASWVWSIEQEFPVNDRDEYADLSVNRYFIDNQNMVIGKMVAVNGKYGMELVTAYNGERPISEEITDRLEYLPAEIVIRHQTSVLPVNTEPAEPEANVIPVAGLKPGNYVITQSGIGIVDPCFIEDTGRYKNTIKPASIPVSKIEPLKALINIRNTVKSLIALQLGDYTASQLKEEQSCLVKQYDKFVNTYGYLNKKSNSKLFSSDPDAGLLLALEKPSNDGEYQKTDIFEKATIRDHKIPTSAATPFDALNISLGVKGCVDGRYISLLCGQEWDEVIDELGDSIYLDTETNLWQPREQYLSGNIRKKLEYAEHAATIDSSYCRNVDALREVLPDPIPAYDIRVRLGATWIPESDVAKFVEHIVAGDNGNFRPQEEFSVSQHAATWIVKVDGWQISVNEGRITQDWGTKRVGAHELIEKLLNNRQIAVKDRHDDGSYIINRDETIAANQKADMISNEFRSWLWSDADRTKRLEQLYNSRYNIFVEPRYTGNTVRLEGITPTLKGSPLEPRDSQKSAIQRYIFEGRSLNAHPVGSGKTLELVGSAMEGKRLGIHKKPLLVVPNNILGQFGRMALELYPGANALVIEPKQLSKNARQVFTGRIATGDWDMVVIAQSSFNKLATPVEHQKSVIKDERYQLQEALSELSTQDNRAAQLTVKRLERALDSLEKKIESLSDIDNKDNLLYLNEIGVDALFVDEADNFLNLYTPTQMGHVPGVNTSASQQAMNLLMAVRYIQEINGNYRGIIFATGTDVRNSMSDMYTMLRYLGPDVLEAAGANNFDSFMGTFGEVVKTIEVTPEGSGYRENSRLSKFTNIPEMVMMYRQVADVLTDKELQLPKPMVDEINVAAKPSDWLRMYMTHLAARAKATRTGSVNNRDDNILKIASDGRKASLDMRLIDSRIPDDPSSKLNKCVDNVFAEWEKGTAMKLTQIIFCDLGVPNNKSGFSVYEDIRDKLISRGIPDSEIAFAQDYKSDVKKKELENAINNGTIRAVIASTETLGVGSNVQERLIAQHNLDAPWRPRDLEQRGGRMERPGNINEVARRYNYSTIDSFDLFMWETLKRKAAFIMQAKTDPKSAAREIEEDLNPTYSEIMSITTGNPLIRDKLEIDSNVERLQSTERSYRRAQWDIRNRINTHKSQIIHLKEFIDQSNKILTAINANQGLLSIQGKIFDDMKKAVRAINSIVKRETENTAYNPVTRIQLGLLGELPVQLVYMAVSGRWAMEVGEEKPRIVSDHKSVRAMVDSLMTFHNVLNRDIRDCERDIDRHDAAIHSLQDSASKPFANKEELEALLARQREVNSELANLANDDINTIHQDTGNFEKEIKRLSQQAGRMRVG